MHLRSQVQTWTFPVTPIDGQMFPANIITNLMWDNSCGLWTKDNFTSVVTSGVGVWGPNMRVGTKSEVAEINIKFTP